MADRNLATYLNDHVAGSVAALELLDHLERAYADTPIAAFVAELRADIVADRGELEALLGRLGIGVSVPRRAAAWLGEKLGELKLVMDDPAAKALRLLETLDIVSTGIEGKRLLWLALSAASESAPGLQGPDYARLVRRAGEQRQRVEAVRQASARAAFRGAAGGTGPDASTRPAASTAR